MGMHKTGTVEITISYGYDIHSIIQGRSNIPNWRAILNRDLRSAEQNVR
jgi:hypothetical protein